MPQAIPSPEFLFLAIHQRTKTTQLVRVTNCAGYQDAFARAHAHVKGMGTVWTLATMNGGVVLNAQSDFVRFHTSTLSKPDEVRELLSARAF